VHIHAVRTWVHKLGPLLGLIIGLSLDGPPEKTRYWGGTLVDADAQAAIDVLPMRWDIEVLFENHKDLSGSDHYQLMNATAIIRFWTLVWCLAHFLDEHQARLQEEIPGAHITLGRARRGIPDGRQRNLLLWLEEQLPSGVAAEQLYARLNAWPTTESTKIVKDIACSR